MPDPQLNQSMLAASNPAPSLGETARGALYEFSLAVARSRSREQIYEAALGCLEESLQLSRASILIYDDQQVMRFVTGRGLSDACRQAVERHSPWLPGTSDPQPLLVSDALRDPAVSALVRVLAEEGIASTAFIPLSVDGELRGKFMLDYPTPHAFHEEELAIARGIASHVGLALQFESSRRAVPRNETRYRNLVQSLGVPIYTTNPTGQIEFFNQAAVRLWGRTPVPEEEFWCGSFKLFSVDGTPLDHDECPMAIALKEDREVRGVEIIVERPDGTRANILPFPTPLHNPEGELIGAVNVLTDITEQKRTQAELLEVLRGKDDFLGQISHELRNPVTQIVGYSELLAKRFRDLPVEAQADSLESINTQAVRLQRLVENMLVLSRFERGVPMTSEPQLIQRLIPETLTEFRGRFPALRLEVNIEPSLPPVNVSASTIDQVVWNLLSNAQKYGRPGGVVELRCGFDGGWVEVAVLDEGQGVAAQEVPKLFQPYFRAAGTPPHIAGLGLGLSVCKRLVEAEQGELSALRRDTGGMEFRLRLRAVELVEAE
ncbi:MAG: ATP-binding protein [Anaerolineaceae bacterium]